MFFHAQGLPRHRSMTVLFNVSPKPWTLNRVHRSALASIENMDNRFDRKAWHNVKAPKCYMRYYIVYIVYYILYVIYFILHIR